MKPPAVAVASFGYHEVTDDPASAGFQRPGALPYKHMRDAFARDLEAIAAGPCAPERVTALDLAAPGRHLLLTFDDGGKSAVSIADTLAARGWRGHFFVVTGLIGTRTFLTAPEIRYLQQCGHVVGSHSETHPDIFREQPFDRMVEEWRVSRDRLAQLLGEPCATASVPGGDISPLVLESADTAGLSYLFTSEPVLRPVHVGQCWVLGRFMPKAWTPAARIGELAAFRGWRRALLLRQLKGLARRTFPGWYRQYVRRTTRDWGAPVAPGDP
jgi:peptidoglycan/xylan/chitin deacetylase (PgdA/CDA1 family)